MADLAEAPAAAPAIRQVLRLPLYRGSAIALFLSGIGASAAAPQIVPFLVNELGTSLPVAGFYYLTSLAGPVAGYLVGRSSDRTGNRLNLFRLCAVAGFGGWALMALSTVTWMPFFIGVLLLGFSGATFSQLFAAVHDEQIANPAGRNDGVVAIVRMANTAGWIVGPVIGTTVGAAFGLRPMLWLTAACFLGQILALGTLGARSSDQAQHAGSVGHRRSPTFREMLPLLAFTGLFVLVYAGESVKYGYLIIYMEEQLHIEPAIRGVVIGLQPFIELLIMPFSVALGRRIGMFWLMSSGAALGVAANLCFALWHDVAGMFAGQILMGGVWGVFMVLGMIVAPRLLPTAVATASAIIVSAFALGSAVGGVAGGFGVSVLGLPHVFLVPATLSFAAILGLAAMARRYDFR